MRRKEATGCMAGEWVALVLLCSYRVSGPLTILYGWRLARQTAPSSRRKVTHVTTCVCDAPWTRLREYAHT